MGVQKFCYLPSFTTKIEHFLLFCTLPLPKRTIREAKRPNIGVKRLPRCETKLAQMGRIQQILLIWANTL